MHNDRQPYVPHKPEQLVVCEITKREAILLQELRQITFGKVTIHKMNGLISRIEPQNSIMITEDEDITLKIMAR